MTATMSMRTVVMGHGRHPYGTLNPAMLDTSMETAADGVP